MASLFRQGGRLAATASTAASSSSRATLPRTFATSSLRLAVHEKDPQLGDYPDVPMKSFQLRKHDKSWFDPQEKRNFGETPSEQDDILSVWGPDLHTNTPPQKAVRHFLIAVAAFTTFFGLVYYGTPERNFIPRTFPRDGLAEELTGPVKAYKEGDFDAKDEEEEEEDE
ncbi:hypothetical protein BDZ90DRAFT_229914 [Jaminaea rosea]|uniref:Uncharacterized protein n=1 Tax=Jaminaea rosea TaxID=1569628 RepID=A0A316V3Y8_9BASI|nr:hypothetical protein BDZ90DRAFT_229914 [Jaminaea rosea]PWN30923.1 hypothetical protein BDZ90DRAFT_229914 [Jaminaea rosea]